MLASADKNLISGLLSFENNKQATDLEVLQKLEVGGNLHNGETGMITNCIWYWCQRHIS